MYIKLTKAFIQKNLEDGKYYIPEKPCVQGHFLRYSKKHNNCVICSSEKSRNFGRIEANCRSFDGK